MHDVSFPTPARTSLVPLIVAASLLAAGCSSTYFKDDTDWEALHVSGKKSAALDQILAAGFGTCRNLMEDAILHATGGREDFSFTGWSRDETDRRTANATVIFMEDGDAVHSDVSAGLDGSGKCFAKWTSTRVWRTSCDRLHRKSEWLRQYELSSKPEDGVSIYQREGSGITVVLTNVGVGKCLMIAGQTAYWHGPSPDAPQLEHFPYTQDEKDPAP
ncbi:hypothetical protein IAE60_06110 [Pseudoxanthomonas mexicana]|uniref:Uncharacterized protein n=1 Tax=Pseudoxanthomonas mexicana TaxID=128785 RepID=A0A7G9TFV6_PSEMX|nr:hypothetical protein [Pseudoxanthomonas mexicana]QNN78981.1 hypothetical protein IAE60_06110 [Pseudoxanthomonas mexicana]